MGGITACLTDLPVLEPLGHGAGGLDGPGHARLLDPVREVEQAAVAVERVPVQLQGRGGRKDSIHQITNSPNCDQKSPFLVMRAQWDSLEKKEGKGAQQRKSFLPPSPPPSGGKSEGRAR